MPTKNIVAAFLAAIILIGGVALVSARDDDNGDDVKERAALQGAKITLSEAIAAAEKEVAGGKALEAEFEIINGTASYTIEIDKDGVQTVLVDAATGNVLKVVAGEWDDDDDDDDDDD